MMILVELIIWSRIYKNETETDKYVCYLIVSTQYNAGLVPVYVGYSCNNLHNMDLWAKRTALCLSSSQWPQQSGERSNTVRIDDIAYKMIQGGLCGIPMLYFHLERTESFAYF